jgi:hypothetical protein
VVLGVPREGADAVAAADAERRERVREPIDALVPVATLVAASAVAVTTPPPPGNRRIRSRM